MPTRYRPVRTTSRPSYEILNGGQWAAAEATLTGVRAFTLLLALCALFVTGCGGGSDEDAAAPVPTTTETTTPESAARPKAPPIVGTTLDGEEVSLAELRGRQVFVNVWSSW